jgi:dihydrofolate reductase
MPKVIIDMTMSLDGYVAGPDDGPEHPLGKHGGMAIFDWYLSGKKEFKYSTGPGDFTGPLLRPSPGADLDQVKSMFKESGAFIFGRKTYDITNGWGGRHPVNGVPVFVLTHLPPPPGTVPKGPSNLTFVTDGIESAVRKAKAVAGKKHVKLGGASPCKQALRAGLVDEILVHLAPYLLGGGVRLFDDLPDGVKLKKSGVGDGPLATHLRYKVVRR